MIEAKRIPEIFGTMVFGDKEMKKRLSPEVYAKLHKTIDDGEPLSPEIAGSVADAMKEWAMERGATHYTHWFQPMTGITAEKHDSFIEPDGNGGLIMKFSGKALIKGEPDASSFPSGGLRATFEARGYTAWDPTSPAFVKQNTLCIPTAFCSYSGEVLDKKTPLLRSMEIINVSAKRILKLFGKSVDRVITTAGAEQEYFLIPKDMYDKRLDLKLCGRTLFGAKPPKGQQLDDHYFGAIRVKVKEFMDELDEELWKLGILAKTEHNEVAPSQHELAPIFTTTNIACDHNQLTMELMKRIAEKHGLVCLLHEKPFAGVNGSGKHNNWSLSTSDGVNLLEPGDSPSDNAQFLLFLTAVISAVDEYADLLRISVASISNDHRLGASEAPPAIVSIFLGEELNDIYKSIESSTPYNRKDSTYMDVGASVLPVFPKDNTDRNRTSPFAFTGNKFEFRMLGANDSIACANIMLNTIVSDTLDRYADALEGVKAEEFNSAVTELIRSEYKAHKRVIFNGNGYSHEWEREAMARGLHNYKTTVDAVPHYSDEKNVAVLERKGIFTATEIASRRDILLENYSNMMSIEAAAMVDIARKFIVPASLSYVSELAKTLVDKKTCGVKACKTEKALLDKLSEYTDLTYDYACELSCKLAESGKTEHGIERARYFADVIKPCMEKLREVADELEPLTAKKYWPYPSYSDLLFGV